MQMQDIFKAFGANWTWASISRTGKARIYTGEPVALASGLIQSPFGEWVSRCEAFDRGELDTPVIWKRTDFTNGPSYETDQFGIPLPVAVPQMPEATPPRGYCNQLECFNEKAVGFNVCGVHRPPQLMAPAMPTQQMPPLAPAPAQVPMVPPKQTRLTTEEAENGGLWAFANQDEDFVHVNCDGVVWFDLFKDGPKPRRSYAVEVDGVTHPIERTRSQPQLAPPEAGKPFAPSNIPPAAPVVNPFAVVLPFIRHAERYRLVGSRVTCNPPPLDTDQDVLVEVHSCNRIAMEEQMRQEGYVLEGSAPTDVVAGLGDVMDPQRVFTSMRKGSMNYILTSDPDFYQRFTAATELAKKFNVLAKADRIAMFQAVLYGNVV